MLSVQARTGVPSLYMPVYVYTVCTGPYTCTQSVHARTRVPIRCRRWRWCSCRRFYHLHKVRDSNPTNTKLWPNAVVMLAQRRRRLANITTTLDCRHKMNQCWFNAGPTSTTLDQHQTSIGSTFFVSWMAHNNPAKMRRWPNVGLLWANVVDGGPTVNQSWANVSCLLGTAAGQTDQPVKYDPLAQCWVNVGLTLRMLGGQ